MDAVQTDKTLFQLRCVDSTREPESVVHSKYDKRDLMIGILSAVSAKALILLAVNCISLTGPQLLLAPSIDGQTLSQGLMSCSATQRFHTAVGPLLNSLCLYQRLSPT